MERYGGQVGARLDTTDVRLPDGELERGCGDRHSPLAAIDRHRLKPRSLEKLTHRLTELAVSFRDDGRSSRHDPSVRIHGKASHYATHEALRPELRGILRPCAAG